MKFSQYFKLGLVQAELDFVDVELSEDTPLYICPYAIEIRDDEWSQKCGDHIRSFFSEVLQSLMGGNEARAVHLFNNLHEPNETRLGQSVGKPMGRGVGSERAERLMGAIKNSRAFSTGVLSDISETELFINGIGRDTISDLTTNVIRMPLAQYTFDQCELHDIQVRATRSLGPIWNPISANWEARELQLPYANGRPVLLVPKFSIRRRLSLDSQEFYNHHMLEYLQEEHLQASSALVETLKNGTRRVTKKALKEEVPFEKNGLADFVRQHPEVLAEYKKLAAQEGALSHRDIEEGFKEGAFAEALIRRLSKIPKGRKDADSFHSICIGICTFLFYPSIINPIKEFPQNSGRKRIDIKYTNASDSGFFNRMLVAAQTRAISIFFECKNYSVDPANPEYDQLTGRFGHTKGFLGFLLCREIQDRDRAIASCVDAARDGRGYVLVLDDSDLSFLLNLVRSNRRSEIEDFLQKRFDQISNG